MSAARKSMWGGLGWDAWTARDIIDGEALISKGRPALLGVIVMASVPARQTAAVPPAESIEQKFERLATAWHKAVAHHSSSRIRHNHPAYQEIIGMGPAVVPLLLRDLDINRRHWFAALADITGADPVSEEDAGNIPQLVEAWLKWGRESGYRW